MKYCEYCGQANDVNSNYCIRCGSNLNHEMSNYNLNQTITNDENTYNLDNAKYKYRYTLALLIYFFAFYILAIIIQYIVQLIVININHIDIDDLLENEALYTKFSSDILAWTNFLTYTITLVCLIPLLLPVIKRDIHDFGKNKKFYFQWVGLGIVIMYVGTIAANMIVTILTMGIDTGGTSENQATINEILGSGTFNMIMMSIITIFLAPVLEELVFRKSLFGLFKKNTIKVVIFSSIIFAAIHVIPACLTILLQIFSSEASWLDLYVEFIYIISYLGQAFAISFVYHKSKSNILPSIFIHFINNLLVIIVNILLMYFTF